MNEGKIFRWSITVALAGFLFGFDTVVISGAEQTLKEIWNSSDLFHGNVVVASALWGTVIGAIFGSLPTDRIGRKQTLIWIGVFYTVSAIGSAFANDPWIFAAFRFLGGLGVGASTIAAPAYVSEIAPAKSRGRLVALYQFNIVFGILIAFISNFALSNFGAEPWRWMIGVEAIPALIYTLSVFGVPKSPRWLLVKKNDREEAAKVLQMINPSSSRVEINTEMYHILEDANIDYSKEDVLDAPTKGNTSSAINPGYAGGENIFMKKYRFPLLLAFLIAFFNQFSGINAFLYYAPRIFEIAGLGESTALLSSIGIGITNLIFTLLGLALIDRLGRKQLMYMGSIGYIVSLALVALAFQQEWQGMAVPIFLFLFIASHAIGQGAVIWVFISEVFPNHLRADGQAFGSSTHWVLAAIIPASVPFLFSTIGAAPVFAFFAFMMVLQLLFVWAWMPETKGVPLEELQEEMAKKSIFN